MSYFGFVAPLLSSLMSPFRAETSSVSKFWSGKCLDDVIREADDLTAQGKHQEAYELLNRIKYGGKLEVQWRVGRALFHLSHQRDLENSVRKEMIEEAYEIITNSLPEGDQLADVHKWAAVIIDRKSGLSGLDSRLRNSDQVKRHLIRCCDLEPSDVVSRYLLGRWCYELSGMSWFQRKIASLLYGQVPKSSYEEAHEYLAKAEELQPQFYLQNTHLLGKTCLKLGQYYKARHYFGIVTAMTATNERERSCTTEAERMLKRLARYDLEKEVLFFEHPQAMGG